MRDFAGNHHSGDGAQPVVVGAQRQAATAARVTAQPSPLRRLIGLLPLRC